MKASVSIIIPTFNNVSGLNYLLNYFKNREYQIIIVDNGRVAQNSKLKSKT